MSSGLAFSVTTPHDRRHHVQRLVRKPQPVLLLKMASKLDHSKPIAAMNNAGVVFAADTLIGSGDHDHIVARTPDGKWRWHYPAAAPLTISPQVIDQDVYLALKSGKLLSLKHSDGKLQWQAKLNSYIERPLAISAGSDRRRDGFTTPLCSRGEQRQNTMALR